ncbi:MBL fold metallo-hydrolase [Hymenobacter sp. DG01]|uniref:MBL fold metallo-hydrolase n=1 Tax=Hymenobacter sp. DG01 TaxID=2584940 RepID=UPI00111E3EB9|nr:MBL fold metallo-hydrolase [Hymenobacter sp. DG01]
MSFYLKKLGLGAAVALVLLLSACTVFLKTSPQFGGVPTKAQQRAYAQSGHMQDGKFVNLLPTAQFTDGGPWVMLWRSLTEKAPIKDPAGPLPMRPLDSLSITRTPAEQVRVTWFGHSASLVEIGGQKVLLDPMLSIKMGPVSWVTPKRYNQQVSISAEQLPAIDAVLISHDHYDHLDYETIRLLKDRVAHFYVPLGVGAHLRAWGVDEARILEMNWGDSVRLPGLTITSTPTRHFSGRGLTNQNSTLWSSWVLKSNRHRVFYSGDGGYGPHFQDIGRQYGPFDLALMECGQYDRQWARIHMVPEESVQAALDVRARVMLPVHWGRLFRGKPPLERAGGTGCRGGQPITRGARHARDWPTGGIG